MSEQVPRTVSMDAGYFSEANVTALADLGCEPLIPPDRQTHGHALPTAPRGRPPAGLSVAERMRRTLQTKRGRRLYARRKAIVEPGVWADQAGPRLPAVLAARAAAGAWGMGPDLHHPQYTEALAGAPATPRTPRRGATGAEREPDESAASLRLAGDRCADRSAHEQARNPPPGPGCSHCNVGQAPSPTFGPRILLSGAAGSSISRETYGQDRRRDHDDPHLSSL